MRYKLFGIYILVILFFLALGLSVLYAGLPFFAQRFIEKRYHQVLTEHNAAFAIQHVGFTRTLLSDLRFGNDIFADLVQLTYDPQGLDLPVAKELVISGLQITAKYHDNRLSIDGVSEHVAGMDAKNSPAGKKRARKKVSDWMSLLPERFVFQNAAMVVTVKGKPVRIPWDMEILLEKAQKTALCSATMYPFGQTVSLATRVDFDGNIQSCKLEALSFALNHLTRFLPEHLAPMLSGAPDLVIEQVSHNNWQVALSGLYPENTRGFGMDRIHARILKDHSQVIVLGEFGLTHPLLSDLKFSSRTLLETAPADDGNARFEVTCESQPTDLLVLADENLTADMEQPLITLALQGNKQAVEGTMSVRSAQILVRREKNLFSLGQASIQSDIVGDLAAGTLTLDLQSQLSKIHGKNDTYAVDFRRMDTAGRVFWDYKKKGPGSFTADLAAELLQGSVSAPAMGIAARGISVSLPVTFPEAKGSGRFAVQELVYDDRLHLDAAGSIRRTGPAAVDFDGIVQVPDAADLSIAFTGNAGLAPDPHVKVDAVSERFRFSPFRFENLLPAAAWSADYDFDVTAKGSFLWNNNQATTGAELVIHEGTLTLPDMDMTAAGIKGTLAIKDLVNPASFPGQVLTIDEIKAGDFAFTDAHIRFTLEEDQHLLVENIRVKWCSGVVSTESVRFPSSDGSVSVTVYCDRIQLNQLLEQLGGLHSRGKGTLNGRIPVRFKDGDISFDNGFLFSTPGQGGRIIINNPKKLLAGIPVDSPRFVQLDLAAEALKDFEYTWAKLTFNTDKDTLAVNMELDGKPGRPLPFVYKKDLGSFVRVDAKSPGSHFQGIKLDVNLYLPFNQVMQFGKKIQKLIK